MDPAATDVLRARGDAAADAATLEVAMAAVAREVELVKSQLYQTVNSHYGDFVATVKSASDLNARVAETARRVQALAQQVESAHSALTANVLAPTVELHHLKSQLAASDLIVHVLGQMAKVTNTLARAPSRSLVRRTAPV